MLTSQEATNARYFDFSLRSATSIEQVDAFMNRLIGTLQHYEQTGRLHADGYTADEVLNITFRKPSSGQGYVRTAVEALRASAEATLRYYENSMGNPGGPALRSPLTRINRVEKLAPHAAHGQTHGTEAPPQVSSHVPAHHAPVLVHSSTPTAPAAPMPAPHYEDQGQAQATPQRRLQPVPQIPVDTSGMPSDIHTLTGLRPTDTAPRQVPAQQQAQGYAHGNATPPAVAPAPFEIPTLAPQTGELPTTHHHNSATAPAIAQTYAGPRGLSGAELAHELGRALHARVNIANTAPHQLTRDLSIKANTPHGTVTVTGVSITADGQIVLQTY